MKNTLLIMLLFYCAFAMAQNETKERNLVVFQKRAVRKITLEDLALKNLNWPERIINDICDFTTKEVGKTFPFLIFGLADAKTNELVVQPFYDYMDDYFDNGLVLARKGRNYYLLNKKGEIVNSDKTSNYEYIDNCNCNEYNSSSYKDYRRVKNKNGKWGFVDSNWNEVLPFIYDSVTHFKIDYCAVKLKGVIGIIDRSGKFLPTNATAIGEFRENGFAVFKNNGKVGIINVFGEIVIPANYAEIDHFYQYGTEKGKEKFSVKINNKYGLIDINEKLIIQPIFDNLVIAQNDYWVAKLNGKIIRINDIGIEMGQYENFVTQKSLDTMPKNTPIAPSNPQNSTTNKYANASFENILIENFTIKYQLEKMFEDMYSKQAVLGPILTEKLLGKEVTAIKGKIERSIGTPLTKLQIDEFNKINNALGAILTQEMVEKKILAIKNTLEIWLDGPMTEAQLKEFNEINKAASR
jgi:hypothetical protein